MHGEQVTDEKDRVEADARAKPGPRTDPLGRTIPVAAPPAQFVRIPVQSGEVSQPGRCPGHCEGHLAESAPDPLKRNHAFGLEPAEPASAGQH